MTEAQQRRFYFPAWNDCAVANRWLMARGRLQADLDAQRIEYASWPEPARTIYLKVVTLADQFAGREHRAVVPDDLRHACNVVATGRQSCGQLNNQQINRVVCLFKLLQDPEDLTAVMNWSNPGEADRKSYVAYLKKQFNEGALIAISRNAFDTIYWEGLDMDKLRWIGKQGSPKYTRWARGRREAVGARREGEADCPF